MIVARFHQANCICGYPNSCASNERLQISSVRLNYNDCTRNKTSWRKGNGLNRLVKKHTIRSFVSCPSASPVAYASEGSLYDTHTAEAAERSDESVLILMRHGESMWNEKNLFTGCVDVPLTEKGVEEAIEAGKRISSVPIDIVYTSALIRSQMTAMLSLIQHRCKTVPTFLHNETEQARIWSQICSEDTIKKTIPIVKAWQLNERMYGNLQGFNKQQTAEKYGKEQVHKWRRSYDVRPPNGESLEMCLGRAVTFFKEQIEPLLDRKHVMVVAHANSLRSIIMYLDSLTSDEVIDLELSTGVPMLYTYKTGKFIRRGSLAGSTEAGVYAHTEVATIRSLSQYLLISFLGSSDLLKALVMNSPYCY